MKLGDLLNEFRIQKATNEKPITHTGMDGGKWSIPDKKMKTLYKKIVKYVINGDDTTQLVERMGEYHPFVIDIDIKYLEEIDGRQYNEDTIQQIIIFLWLNMSILLNLEDRGQFGEIWIMEKDKPYPCVTNKKFKSKDGIHIVFPSIIINKKTYKQIINILKEQREIERIFNDTCDIPPSNTEDTLLDGCFTGWQPYGCSKKDESYYKLTQVFRINDNDTPYLIDQELFNESYTNDLTIMKTLSMRGHTEENITYREELESLVENKLKKTNSTSSISSMDNIYGGNNVYYVDHNDVINPYDLVEKNENELIKGLVSCLSPDRASEYGKWLSVGMCLHNINPDNFKLWCDFSRQDSSYDENVCVQKWESFRNDHDGSKLGKGSLYHWAKCDNKKEYYKSMKKYLHSQIERSINKGPDAHHLLALVIAKYFENQFICVDINDDWYYFNGVRWTKTMKANKLKRCIHDDIYKIYEEYGQQNKENMNKEEEGTTNYKIFQENHERCHKFQQKLYQEPYVNTIIGALRHIFYKEGVMEEFDTDNNLLGFENGIYDLKLHQFREGRPEDYVTLSNKIILPINGPIEPGENQEKFRKRSVPDSNLELADLVVKTEAMDNYDALRGDMMAFIEQIIPNDDVRKYVLRFISKCLSGENRDEGFYIWTGSGGNGKSKLVELIQLALGEYACNLPVSLLTQKRKASGAASPEMARTRGKRFVVMQEPDVNETLNVGEMKEITGNDKIQARGLFKEPFEFTPQYKLVLMCNDLPNIPSNDDGTWRRLEAVPFVSRFVSEDDVDIKLNRYPIDKQLKQKLPYWIVPLMLILLQEWKEYDTKGIVVPMEVKDRTSEYRNSNDIIGQWITDNCMECDNIVEGVNEYAPTDFDNLYAEFVEWCDDQEEKNRPDKKKVKEALKKWQSKSKYGLSISKKKSDNLPNGSEAKPRFNLKVV